MEHAHWPLFGLEIRFGVMTLRYPDDDLLIRLVRLAAGGVHDPDSMPFEVPWTRFESPRLEQEALRFHWQCRVDTRPESFRIPLVALVGDVVVGASEVGATDLSTLGQFATGSWLGMEFHRRGYGTLMRRASLALGFDGLGAEFALTSAWDDNAASLGVTRNLGYREVGRRRSVREGAATTMIGFEMSREHFAPIRPDDIDFVGLDATREFLEIS